MEIKVNISNVNQYYALTKNLKNALESKDYLNFIRNKAKKELEDITRQSLSGTNEQGVSTYSKENKSRVDKHSITFWNNAMVDLSEVSAETLENYPNGLSMSKLIEYGSGITGQTSEAAGKAAEEGWAYDVNNHGVKGWTYYKNGSFHRTTGIEGKLIYHKLALRVEEKISSWTAEYLKTVVRRK